MWYKYSFDAEIEKLKNHLINNHDMSKIKNFVRLNINIFLKKYLTGNRTAYSYDKNIDPMEWYRKSTDTEKLFFYIWLKGINKKDISRWAPGKVMQYQSDLEPQWIVHFTNDPYSISNNGFWGHDKLNSVHFTTFPRPHTQPDGDPHQYVFGYPHDSSELQNALDNNETIGDHAVMFFTDGINVLHHLDKENQGIFSAKDIDKKNIIPIFRIGEMWIVKGIGNHIIFKNYDFNECMQFIKKNFQALVKMKNKDNMHSEQALDDYVKIHDWDQNQEEDDAWNTELPN